MKVLPLPVTPSRTWCLSPRRSPSASSAMARGWSPAGLEVAHELEPACRPGRGRAAAPRRAHGTHLRTSRTSASPRLYGRPGGPSARRPRLRAAYGRMAASFAEAVMDRRHHCHRRAGGHRGHPRGQGRARSSAGSAARSSSPDASSSARGEVDAKVTADTVEIAGEFKGELKARSLSVLEKAPRGGHDRRPAPGHARRGAAQRLRERRATGAGDRRPRRQR